MLSPQKGFLICLIWLSFQACRPSSGNEDHTLLPDQPVWLHDGDVWVNLRKAPGPNDLQKQPALLYFFNVSDLATYAEIKQLQSICQQAGIPLICVHGPRFPYEMDAGTLFSMLPEAFDSIPVLNDPELALMHGMGLRNWGAAVLLDPHSAAALVWMQLPETEKLYSILADKMKEWRASKALTAAFYDWDFSHKEPEACDISDIQFIPALNQLVLCDRKNNYVILADTLGNIRHVIGNGRPGLQTGRFELTQMHQPEFAVPDPAGRYIYIGLPQQNRVIRADLEENVTEEWLENKIQSVQQGNQKIKMRLCYPSQLFFSENKIYIYFQGNKLLLDYTDASHAKVVSGQGSEGITDGPGDMATLSGMSSTMFFNRTTWFTDDRNSAIRTFDGAAIKTLCGKGSFESGHRDGPLTGALFQRPTSIIKHGNDIYIADYYNKSLRKISIKDSLVKRVKHFETLKETPCKICSSGRGIYLASRNGQCLYTETPDSGVYRKYILKGLQILPKYQNEELQTPDTIALTYQGPLEIIIDSGTTERLVVSKGNIIQVNGMALEIKRSRKTLNFMKDGQIQISYQLEVYDTETGVSSLKRRNLIIRAGSKKGGKNKLILPLR